MPLAIFVGDLLGLNLRVHRGVGRGSGRIAGEATTAKNPVKLGNMSGSVALAALVASGFHHSSPGWFRRSRCAFDMSEIYRHAEELSRVKTKNFPFC
jgi:hypothetical protein